MFSNNLLFKMSAFLIVPFMMQASTQQATKDRMKADLEMIRNIFEVEYAPKEWKHSYSGWNLDQEIEKAKAKVQNAHPLTTKEFQKIVRDFFYSTKDYHVSLTFHSTEEAKLPFRVKGADGGYFITWIDEDKLSNHACPFRLGDQIVTFDNRPIEEVIKELTEKEARSTNSKTDETLAELILTTRKGRLGHEIPRGPITIGVKSPFSTKCEEYQLIWDYTPELITNGFKGSIPNCKPATQVEKYKKRLLSKQMVFPFYEAMYGCDDCKKGKDEMGARESYIPALGLVLWQTPPTSPFHAYLYQNAERRLIGYLRIPHYILFESDIEELAKIIAYFQKNSEALVIDQINNPGGLIFSMYSIASMLTEKPLQTPKHRMTITQESVAEAIEELKFLETIRSDKEAMEALGETFLGFPVSYQMIQFFKEYLCFIIDEWNAGHTFTQPNYLFSIDKINPSSLVRYTKPIVVVVNCLDFSAGDFFPAILQDNKRATIFGERTAGAGGYVKGNYFPNRFGLDFLHYTASIAERSDKKPIENLGVMPDISYSLSQDDLSFGFDDYAKAINNAVNARFNYNFDDEEEDVYGSIGSLNE